MFLLNNESKMRKKTETYQRLSIQSPGRNGPGLPKTKSIFRCFLRQSVKALRCKKISIIKNSLFSSYANFKNFVLIRQTSERAFCPYCEWQGPAFIATSNWRAAAYNSACPKCGSYSRHRGISKLLIPILEKNLYGNVLIFAPESIILKHLQKYISKDKIKTTDKFRVDVDYPGEDIQNLSFKDDSFSMIICNHVLEHVPDDQKALLECSRILKPGGVGLFTLPGDFTRKDTWIFDRADDNGHYRHYGLAIVGKIKNAFCNVDTIDMHTACPKSWKVREHDYVFICTK